MKATDNTTQLTLLAPASVPAQFQLSAATRRRGMRHIAEIRAQLAASEAATDLNDDSGDNVRQFPRRSLVGPTGGHTAA